jgi:hypothetical protein
MDIKEEVTSLERLRRRIVKDMMALENEIMDSMGRLIDEVNNSNACDLRAHEKFIEADMHLKINTLYSYARLMRDVEDFWVNEHKLMVAYDS